MFNIYLTPKCNLHCDSCLVKGLGKLNPKEMATQNFKKIIRLYKEKGVKEVRLVGGEPTMHTDFPGILKIILENGLSLSLFTNGLFATSLIKRFKNNVSNILVNVNVKSKYKKHELDLLHKNLFILSKKFPKALNLAFTFSPQNNNLGHIIEIIENTKISRVRVSLAHPSFSKQNLHLNPEEYKNYYLLLSKLQKILEEKGIALDVDCIIPPCVFPAGQKTGGMQNSFCGNPLLILPNLDISVCPSLDEPIGNLEGFDNINDIQLLREKKIKEIMKKEPPSFCSSCIFFKTNKCQGGCLGLR